MATTQGSQQQTSEMLNELIELEFNVIEAYHAAIERLDEQNDKTKFRHFLADHQRHVSDLSTLVRNMGVEPKNKGDIKEVLTKGKVVLAGLVGDRAILAAMKSNEDNTNEAYEKDLSHPGLPQDVRTQLQKNLDDERRHRAWIEERQKELESAAKYRKSA